MSKHYSGVGRLTATGSIIGLVLGLLIACGNEGAEARTAGSITKEIVEHFKPPESIGERPPPRFVAPKFNPSDVERATAVLVKARVTRDEKTFSHEPWAKSAKDITELVCDVYGYYAVATNPLPSEDAFVAEVNKLLKVIPTPPSVQFREASNDVYQAINAARNNDAEGVRNASIAAVCDIVDLTSANSA